ncbi:putative short-chain oxidoreductase [Lentinula detonsa]|uniref:Short-chain oxidoreductase n=1 Tax=Lentinula detonsa TaxID=2804962 RepID=A0A9W8P0E2_9AGAR|nr:putative short-chain oxidoreductase [Lentinula detonsa]
MASDIEEPQVVLITGCSTGLGRCIAEEALARGMRVIATARRLSTIEDLRDKGARTFTLNVDDKPEVLQSFAVDSINAFGQVDILINNAGWLLGGAIEENTPEEIQSQFNTNFFSVISITNAFMPHFRSRRTGTIVNISSQGSYLSLSGAGIYCASKAALDCLTEAWSNELAPFNIRAVSVILGAFRTSVASSNSKAPTKTIEGYDLAHDFHKRFQERSGHELGDPVKGAKKILDLVTMKTEKPLPVRFALGDDAVYLSRQRLEQRISELDEWKSYGMDTNAEGMKYERAHW